MVFVCVSHVTTGAEHLFMDLLAICASSMQKCLLGSFAYFSAGCFLFSFRGFLHILDVDPLSDVEFVYIFSHFMDCIFFNFFF